MSAADRAPAFDAAARAAIDAHASGDERAFEQAFRSFYREHLERDMRARVRAFHDKGVERDVAMQEITLVVYKKIVGGKDVNYAIMRRVYNGVLHDLGAAFDRAPDDDDLQLAAVREQLPEAEQREMDELLDAARERMVERGSRWAERVRVFDKMRDGWTNAAEIGRELAINETSARTARYYVLKHLRDEHPELRDYLEREVVGAAPGRAAPRRKGADQ